MRQQNKQSIIRFIADEQLAGLVKEMLLESFMKKRDGDVQTKAAQMMAIDLLQDSWRDLEQLKNKQKDIPQVTRQPGL